MPVSIHGKQYHTVNERIVDFRGKYEGFSITTDLIENTETFCIFKATVSNSEGIIVATGHAMEVLGSSNINKTSHIENCETSAIGRALACFGIGADGSFASADEVANAIKQQENAYITSEQYNRLKELIGTNDMEKEISAAMHLKSLKLIPAHKYVGAVKFVTEYMEENNA